MPLIEGNKSRLTRKDGGKSRDSFQQDGNLHMVFKEWKV
jgi:hypothetical protein